MRCSGSRILMLRTRGLAGPFVQPWGANACVRGPGAALAPGGPLSGPKATNAWVNFGEPTYVYVRFTQPIQLNGACALPYGMTVTVDSVGATITALEQQDNNTVLRLTVPPAIDPGDEVVWAYTEGSPACIQAQDKSLVYQPPTLIESGWIRRSGFTTT